jgi:hypothetical protein
MLFAVDLDEHLVDVKGIAESSVISSQSSSANCSKFNAPQPDRFFADGDSSLSQKVLNIAVTQIETLVKPDSVGDDVGRESVPFVCIHTPILPIWAV